MDAANVELGAALEKLNWSDLHEESLTSVTIKHHFCNHLGLLLWWADDPSVFVTRDKSNWQWTMLIAQPDWILPEHIEGAVETVRKKDLASLDKLRSYRLADGRSMQVLHKGSYADEGPTLHRLHHEFMPEHGLTFNGHHHEIYLSDARRTAPEKLKTILRQPVRPI